MIASLSLAEFSTPGHFWSAHRRPSLSRVRSTIFGASEGPKEKSMALTPELKSTNGARARDLLSGIKVVDSDTHLSEPHDLWTSRAPEKWKDRVPQVREVDGKPKWIVNGH